MIRRLSATRLDRQAETGRTCPAFIVCEDDAGDETEVVVKVSSGCDLGVTSLAIELFAACVAARLTLPVPEPLIVEMSAEWLAAIQQSAWSVKARTSSICAFGSRRLPPAYRTWIAETPLVGGMAQSAASILLFDAITDNPDRRVSNPNCLVRGDDIRIIDHELALTPAFLLSWRPPWEAGSMATLSQPGPGAHIFYNPLRKHAVDWDSIRSSWIALSDEDLSSYREALPVEWGAGMPAIDKAIEKIVNARANIDGCIVEVQRLLA